MGYSTYSHTSYTSTSRNLSNLVRDEIFTKRKIEQTMSPDNLSVRECLDSEFHPESFPIIIGLDVTGSMGYIPESLIKNGLGTIMHTIINESGIDPSVCFVAIGDQFSDNAPIQIGQFESGDQELIKWLKNTYLEGGGGGSSEESYQLAWYFALNHTKTDHWEKRKKKGIIITIGDEATHKDTRNVSGIFGLPQEISMTTEELLEQTKERWNVYHIHANDGSYPTYSNAGRRIVESWEKLLGKENVIIVDNYKDIPKTISKIVSGEHTIKENQTDENDKKIML